MKISILHPSRGRPIKAFDAISFWMDNISTEIEIEYILSLDTSDPSLEEYKKLFNTKETVIINDNDSVVEATNAAAKKATGDILVYLSDDFKCPKNWDKLIAIKLKNKTKPCLLKVNDCLQPFENAVLTIPIINRELYNKLGYFWHPEYKSIWVDVDLFFTCFNNKWIEFAPELKFPHEHYVNNKAPLDETYKQSEQNWAQGMKVFLKRKELNFQI